MSIGRLIVRTTADPPMAPSDSFFDFVVPSLMQLASGRANPARLAELACLRNVRRSNLKRMNRCRPFLSFSYYCDIEALKALTVLGADAQAGFLASERNAQWLDR